MWHCNTICGQDDGPFRAISELYLSVRKLAIYALSVPVIVDRSHCKLPLTVECLSLMMFSDFYCVWSLCWVAIMAYFPSQHNVAVWLSEPQICSISYLTWVGFTLFLLGCNFRCWQIGFSADDISDLQCDMLYFSFIIPYTRTTELTV